MQNIPIHDNNLISVTKSSDVKAYLHTKHSKTQLLRWNQVICSSSTSNSATELPLAESSLMPFACRDIDIWPQVSIIMQYYSQQQNRHENINRKNLFTYWELLKSIHTSQGGKKPFIFFFQPYSRFKCHCGIKGVY